MRLLLDRGVPKGGGRQILAPWREIIPLGIELSWPNGISLSFHPGSGRLPKVRGLIDWLVEALKPAKFPWFGHEFIQLHEICTVYKAKPLPRLFGGVAMEGW